MMPVEELERLFLSRLERVRADMAVLHPTYEFSIWSSPLGRFTEYQGHDLGIEAVFPDADSEEANNVAISIGLMHLTTRPLISDASVAWGQGWNPGVSLHLLDEPVPLSRDALALVGARFDDLVDTFQAAVAAWAKR